MERVVWWAVLAAAITVGFVQRMTINRQHEALSACEHIVGGNIVRCSSGGGILACEGGPVLLDLYGVRR